PSQVIRSVPRVWSLGPNHNPWVEHVCRTACRAWRDKLLGRRVIPVRAQQDHPRPLVGVSLAPAERVDDDTCGGDAVAERLVVVGIGYVPRLVGQSADAALLVGVISEHL